MKPLDGFEERLASGELVDLNSLRSAEQLLPVLDAFDSSAERSFVAQEIWKRAHLGKIPNVGELARIRVPASEIEGDRRLSGFHDRLTAARQRTGGDVPSLSLFTLAQLRKVKPRLLVRTPSQFRTSFWLWTALFFLSFIAVHAVWRFRRFQGDPLLLPISPAAHRAGSRGDDERARSAARSAALPHLHPGRGGWLRAVRGRQPDRLRALAAAGA